jgi:hypothetical protein
MTHNLRRQLDVTLSLNIPFPSSKEAKAVVNALIPDNSNFPKGLSMRIFSKGATVAVQLTGKNVPPSTILNTLDEVLEHISISKKVMTG